MITYDIDLCIGMEDQGSAITVKCCDTGVNIRTYLYVCRHGKWRDAHKPYSIPAGCTPVIKIAKPDKTFFLKEGVVQANSVLFETKPQAFTASGTAEAEVSVYDANGQRITTASFTIHIPAECTSKCEGESGNYVDVVSQQIRAAIDAEVNAGAAASRAEEDAERAETAADRAENAVCHGPKIQDGTWWLWDFEKVKYVDTGIKAAVESSGIGAPGTGKESARLNSSGEASGEYATAAGQDTIASGHISYAQGYKTKSTGNQSHAEGNATTASGDYAHAEGVSSIASGKASHAEGYKCTIADMNEGLK